MIENRNWSAPPPPPIVRVPGPARPGPGLGLGAISRRQQMLSLCAVVSANATLRQVGSQTNQKTRTKESNQIKSNHNKLIICRPKVIMQFSGCLAMVLLATIALSTPMPMANEDELVALDSVEQVEQPQDMRHILKIAPKQADTELVEDRTGVYDTIVEQLRAAGVQTSEQKPLQTLSYKELTRLLALWHMSQGRNYYEAEGKHARGAEQFVAAATTRPIAS